MMITIFPYSNLLDSKLHKMLRIITVLLSSCLFFSCNPNTSNQKSTSLSVEKKKEVDYAMVIHGGAGTILKKNMTAEKEANYTETLNEALSIGEAILKSGRSSLEAVTETIKFMENSPLFNAGKGAVFTNQGTNELDASIMSGHDKSAGAVGGVTNIKNPILAARALMEKSEHVMMVGKGAEAFSESQGIETIDPSYFKTESRWNSLQKSLEKEKTMGSIQSSDSSSKFGTVGAVALDKNGNIVAGTSTGGMTNKRYNRIGDSPIIGAGTYADNNTCGVSCTGHGEYFIRYAVAYDVSAMMEYKNVSLEKAAGTIVNEKLKKAGGSGGLIALDKHGNISMPFNTAGMYRGYVTDSKRYIGIYKE